MYTKANGLFYFNFYIIFPHYDLQMYTNNAARTV